jgi:hypothetical protein
MNMATDDDRKTISGRTVLRATTAWSTTMISLLSASCGVSGILRGHHHIVVLIRIVGGGVQAGSTRHVGH